jgi:uncharacterized protein
MVMGNMIEPLIGGALIGMAATVLLLVAGRVAGISGIVAGLLRPSSGDRGWRFAFVVGLFGTGALLASTWPEAFVIEISRPIWLVVVAGLLVGFGSRLGNGCTSGHGVCGLARTSPRSLAVTLTFIATGVLAATVTRLLAGGS